MRMKGRQLFTLAELAEAAAARKAVTCPGTVFARTAAAFVINLSGAVLVRLFAQGVYVYETSAKDSEIKEIADGEEYRRAHSE